MKITSLEYFKRQTTLSEIGEEGQQLLQNAKVLVIGCGGLGSPLAIYLSSSGVGNIHLVDFDVVSVSNLHRQVFYKLEDVGKFKAEVLANEIEKRTPFTKTTFSKEAISKKNILVLVSQFDVVVDGTDNLQIKYLINDACVLANKPLVYGSLYKFDGYVATFNMVQDNGKYSCNLRDAFPKIATDIPNCEEAGTLNPIVGIIALLQANEVIKIITKTGKLLMNQLLIYNVLENAQFKMKLKKNEDLNIAEIFEKSNYLQLNCAVQDEKLCISASKLKVELNKNQIEVISVINNLDTVLPFVVHQKLPHKFFEVTNFKPVSNKKYIIICNKGISSYDITLKIKDKYPNLEVYSLTGGIENF